jgi:hypothetical protein
MIKAQKLKNLLKKILWIVREHVNEYECDNTINLTIGWENIKEKQLKLKRKKKHNKIWKSLFYPWHV